MLMLLSMHMTSVLFLVQFNNFTLTMDFLTLAARSYALLVVCINRILKSNNAESISYLLSCTVKY